MGATGLRFLGHEITQEELGLIREVVTNCDRLSRMELANTVCELLGWTRPSGRLKGRECWEFLEKLESEGALVLPQKRAGRPLGRQTEVPVTQRGEPGEELVAAAGELGRIEVELVRTEEGRRLFRELVGRYHYLGHAVPFGAQLRYLVYSSSPERTLVGCIQFSSPAWRIGVRDRWIGWDDATRARNLQHVVSNSRYLLLPWIRVKNLASRVLSKSVRQMLIDWQEHYAVEPLLVETLVDPTRYRGTSYVAANWIELGRTSGQARVYRQRKRVAVVPKIVLVYPLVRDAIYRLRGT
jgi:hypothetical protein